jgi:hypothetical protein
MLKTLIRPQKIASEYFPEDRETLLAIEEGLDDVKHGRFAPAAAVKKLFFTPWHTN